MTSVNHAPGRVGCGSAAAQLVHPELSISSFPELKCRTQEQNYTLYLEHADSRMTYFGLCNGCRGRRHRCNHSFIFSSCRVTAQEIQVG